MRFAVHVGGRLGVLLLIAWLARPAPVAAQGAVGSGPLTGSLANVEPQVGVISLGFLKLAPGLTIREIGFDDNVFDEAVNPKKDFVAAGTPDIAAFMRLPLVQFSAYGGVEMQYYKDYESERDISPQARARVDFLLSRVRPFVGAGETRSRTRPNGEIDVRASQIQDELSGGVGFELSAHSTIFGSMIATKNKFEDATQSGVDLAQSLNREGTEYMGGLRTDLTPLTSMQLRGSYKKDEFRYDPQRNGDSRSATAVFTFAPEAVITGTATVGFQDYKPVDPLVEPYRGLTGSGFITYSLLEVARISVGYIRGMDYSFDVNEAYFVQNAVNFAYTMRIAGDFDFQVRSSLASYNYGNRVGADARRDTFQDVGGSLGYNLRNRTRVALNYEYAERQSPEIAERNYIRRRTYLNWALAF
jgi:Putative beta-barrel porin 2